MMAISNPGFTAVEEGGDADCLVDIFERFLCLDEGSCSEKHGGWGGLPKLPRLWAESMIERTKKIIIRYQEDENF